MTKKSRNTTTHTDDPSAGWTRSTEMRVNGRLVQAGTEISVKGERGRFRFVNLTRTPQGVEWVEVIGGPKGAAKWRSFRADKIRTVHVKKTTITGSEAKALLKEKRALKKGATK